MAPLTSSVEPPVALMAAVTFWKVVAASATGPPAPVTAAVKRVIPAIAAPCGTL